MISDGGKFKDVTATKKIFQMRKRIRAVSGGTAASKTISILVWLIDYAQSKKNEIITVVAESVPHLLLGAIRDFKAIMTAQGYFEEKRFNESKHIYQFSSGSIIEFISFDKFSKAHGPRRDVLFLNEANNIPYAVADQLITRTRNIVWMDWNPSEEFYFYTEMLPNRKDDIEFIKLTYLDNEALDDISKREIEAHRYNTSWWKVYGLGELGVIESRIYRDWKVIDEVPHEARLERYGVDFGYTNDPSAIVAVYYHNGGYILDEVAFQKEMSNKQIAEIIKLLPNAIVIADSAEPKSIDEIHMYGLVILPATKGKGSVSQGIQFVQNQKISITRNSVNILKEYRNYCWMTDKNGKIINEDEHEYSNSMDAIRYAFSSLNPEVVEKGQEAQRRHFQTMENRLRNFSTK